MPSKTFSIHLNKDEIISLCSELNVTDNDLAKSIKCLLFNKTHSRYYPQHFAESFIPEPEVVPDVVPEKITADELMKMPISEVKLYLSKIKDSTLKKALGIKSTNHRRVVAYKGLYGTTNLQKYCDKFFAYWRNDMSLLPELYYQLDAIAKDELMMREYIDRSKVDKREPND